MAGTTQPLKEPGKVHIGNTAFGNRRRALSHTSFLLVRCQAVIVLSISENQLVFMCSALSDCTDFSSLGGDAVL